METLGGGYPEMDLKGGVLRTRGENGTKRQGKAAKSARRWYTTGEKGWLLKWTIG